MAVDLVPSPVGRNALSAVTTAAFGAFNDIVAVAELLKMSERPCVDRSSNYFARFQKSRGRQ